jgi:exopolyphosphatase / guanosine-5'-triphosphate,3'-diphosphate pyrophosphatase
MRAKHAVVSIGTNSTRLLIVGLGAGGRLEPLVQRSIGTRLGANLLELGRLDPDGVARTLDVIDRYAAIVREEHASSAAIATSAMRRAIDAPAFAAEVERRVGSPLEILPGEREAELSFRGVISAHRGRGKRVGVLDVGGGSAEYACGYDAIEANVSCEIGAVRLSEALPELFGAVRPSDPAGLERRAREHAAERLQPLRGMPVAADVYAVGGTVFNAAVILTESDGGNVDGTLLERRALTELAQRFLGMTIEERRAVPRLSAQRADIFPAGLLIVDEVLRIIEVDRCRVSRADLLYGYLVDRYGTGPQ